MLYLSPTSLSVLIYPYRNEANRYLSWQPTEACFFPNAKRKRAVHAILRIGRWQTSDNSYCMGSN